MGKSGNIPAGSVIDTGVTILNSFDFFLCSHETIQVIFNETNIFYGKLNSIFKFYGLGYSSTYSLLGNS